MCTYAIHSLIWGYDQWKEFLAETEKYASYISIILLKYRRKVHTTRTFFTPTTHEIRGMRVV